MKMKTDYHIPVLLEESIKGLEIKQDGLYVDVTFGAGGHSRHVLEKLSDKGRLIAFDQDEDAWQNVWNDSRLTLIRSNFKWVSNFLKLNGIEKVDGLLADLGVSSHQFDVPERGFTYREDAPLDMRMNQVAKLKASDVLNQYDFEKLVEVFSSYGEIRNSKTLARVIVERREKEEFLNTRDLIMVAENLVMGSRPKYFAQLFQALRIEVNEEMKVLERLMEQCEKILKPGGRLVVISYHSLEDRVIKNFMRSGKASGKVEKDDFGNPMTPWKIINKKVIVPSEKEVQLNTRAKSAKLRIAEKLENG